MINFVLLAFASLAMSSAIAYLWWAKVRVFLLRESLFKTRDRLWVIAYKMDALSDPAYLAVRRHLNAHIHMASLWSVPAFNQLSGMVCGETSERVKSTRYELQEAIDEAYEVSSENLMDYVLFWRASGWSLLCRLLAKTFYQFSFDALRTPYREMKTWLMSSVPEDITSLENVGKEQMAR